MDDSLQPLEIRPFSADRGVREGHDGALVDRTLSRACPQCENSGHKPLAQYSADTWHVVECVDCGFVYLLDPPDYTRLVSEFAWEKTRAREVERRRTARPVLRRLDEATRWRAELLSSKPAKQFGTMFPPGNVLDVGCGAGKKIPEPFTPFGIEISEELARVAHEHMSRRGGKCLHGSAIDGIARFPDRSFTGVLLRSFLEHETEPKLLLRHAARVLAPGGTIFVRVPNYGSINRRVLGRKWCGFRYPDHVNYFTLGSLKRMAAGCGLTVRLVNALLYPFNDNINAVLTPSR
jgi:SAM-dependent methyltransferase